MRKRHAPNIKLAPIPKDFGTLLVHEFDWWQEVLNLSIPPILWKWLKGLKAMVVEKVDRLILWVSFL